MNKRIVVKCVLAAVVGITLLGAGCGKHEKAADTVAAQSFQQLPEATNVLAALNQKDYENALSSLAKLKESVSTDQQEAEYAALTRKVRDTLFEASSSDPKAAEAFQALRAASGGR